MDARTGDKLIALARSSDPESRTALLLELGDLCARKSFGFTEEARTAEDIFLRLARRAELAVRAELAARVAAAPWAPRELILFLAHDEIDAAGPVLTASPVLREGDLVDIAQSLGRAHRTALARRPGLPAAASEAVASHGEQSVIRILLDNPTAEITRPALQHCARAARTEIDIWGAIIRREGLDEQILKMAHRAAGKALGEEIARHYPDFAAQIRKEAGDAAAAIIEADLKATGMSANERLVETMARTDRLTPELLVEALGEGKVLLFELALARMAGCTPAALRNAIDWRGATAVAIACRAAKAPGKTCAELCRELHACGRLKAAVSRETLNECAKIYQDYQPDTAAAALRQIGAEA